MASAKIWYVDVNGKLTTRIPSWGYIFGPATKQECEDFLHPKDTEEERAKKRLQFLEEHGGGYPPGKREEYDLRRKQLKSWAKRKKK